MTATGNDSEGTRGGAALGGFVAASLAGVGLSIYLTWVHLSVKSGEVVEGLCNVSSKINCNVAAGSEFSAVAGIPIALLGLGFYIGTLVLLIMIKAGKDKWAPAILMTLYAVACAYSVFLAGISAFVLGAFCWACTGLYVINVAGLLLSRALSGKGYGATIGGVFKNLSDLGSSPGAIGFVLSFVASVVVGVLVLPAPTKPPVGEALSAEDPRVVAWIAEYEKLSTLPADLIAELHQGPAKGAAGEGAVAVVEFSDFECPFCSKVAPMMMKLVEENPTTARVHFMQNPLDMACNPRLSKPFHKNACNGAKAAICADEQGAFWKMHDKLFENQRALGAPALSEYAKALGLTVKEFDDCMASERPGKIIERDLALSKRVGVRGTPTIVIGNRLIPGALPYWKLKAAVDHELKRGATPAN